MGIVSLAVEYNSIILLGIDTHCCKGHQAINDLLTAHICKLRKQFPDGWIIHIPEVRMHSLLFFPKHALTDNIQTGKPRTRSW